MKKTALNISLLAISAALVAVFTLVVRIPTPATGGYVSLCDAAVTFAAFAFGPLAGFIAGGVGTAIADLIGGYPQWAAVSFVVHGVEGLLIGLIVRGVDDKLWKKIVAAVVAAVVVSGGYFVLSGCFLTTFSAALAEVIPNLIQGGVGGVIGLVLYLAVGAAYRNLDSLRLTIKKSE